MFDHEQVEPAYPGDAKPARVEAMFDRIAPRYDQLNRVLSAGLDRGWRRALVAHALVGRARTALDVATGTADVALALAAAGVAEVVGVDLAEEMLARGRTKAATAGLTVRLARADAEALPFADGAFDAVTCAFGVRNVAHLTRGLAELRRVVRPGGTLAILELSTPTDPTLRLLHGLYTTHVLPRLGAALTGEGAAYAYLPTSVAAFPDAAEVVRLLGATGLVGARARPLSSGLATLYVATAP